MVIEDLRTALVSTPEMKAFDTEITLHALSALGVLHQMGVIDTIPSSDIFQTIEWEDIYPIRVSDNSNLQAMIKTYVIMKTKIFFDPPTGKAAEFIEAGLREQEWRLREEYDVYVQPNVTIKEVYDE